MMSVDMADWGIPVLGRIYGSWNFGTFVQGFLFATIVFIIGEYMAGFVGG